MAYRLKILLNKQREKVLDETTTPADDAVKDGDVNEETEVEADDDDEVVAAGDDAAVDAEEDEDEGDDDDDDDDDDDEKKDGEEV